MSHYNLGFYGYKYWSHLFGILYQSIYDYVRLEIFKKKTVEDVCFSTGAYHSLYSD